MIMSIPYEQTGRARQKSRTRRALIDAARRLLSEGATPTVEDAADAAEVSRATAYRYFPNRRSLLVATFPEVAADSLLPDPPPKDASERFGFVMNALISRVLEHEAELRAQLRLSLEHDAVDAGELPFRTGRAAVWIEDALAPLRGEIPTRDVRRLVLALRCAVGVEALTWLTDVARLPREQAAEQMRWAAEILFRAVAGHAEREAPDSANAKR
jgi:AcrR family transcriptional regulator